MLLNRRNFVQSAACVAVAPAFASLFSLPSAAQSNGVLLPEPIPGQNSEVVQTTASGVLFKIHGWDCIDRNVNPSQPISADPIAKAFDDGRPTIRVTQSWRTAWR